MVLLVTQGEVILNWKERTSSGQLELLQGQSVFVPALLDEFEVQSNKKAVAFKVNAS